ncbi:MAG: multiubiquitin domain-containing protein [Clostridia bacterium]|nr:multiubiquitin domain-containing protein [Clostridia bacterium]
MFSHVDNNRHPMPNPTGDEAHRRDHPEKPTPPVGPGHPEKPTPPVGPDHPSPPEKPKEPITIIVNGVDKVLPAGTIQLSYDEVVKLAYPNYSDTPNILYTVVFSNGPIENKKGTLVKGDTVRVREEMIFNVGKSNKS